MVESESDLDAVTVRRLLDLGGEDLLRRLVSLLLDLAPQHLDVLRYALANGDLTAVRRAAHSLRSTAGTVGATALLDGCRRLEEASDLAEARARTAALEDEWAGLQTRLRHWGPEGWNESGRNDLGCREAGSGLREDRRQGILDLE